MKISLILKLLLAITITETLSQACKEGSEINDHLGQRHVCRGGKLIVCRVRREWIGMLPGERYRFIYTLKKTSERQDYQSLVKTHTKQFESIHNKKQFLAWHRWYLLKMENILREVDPIVTMPYWDWSLWSGEPWLNEIMSVWSDAPWGLGGNGGGRDDCVYSGPFRKDQWWLGDGGCLKRKFNGKPPDCIAVHKCLRTSHNNFPEFERTLRVNLHNDMHCRIGGRTGTMCGIYSANAPEFLLHHAFTDKIWTDWQKKGSRYKNAYTQIAPSNCMESPPGSGLRTCWISSSSPGEFA